ncbi:hypothetical protein FKM82_004865 [Ascaphus truei]
MSATILTDWCSRAGLDRDKAFLVTGIPDTVDDEGINGVLETVQALLQAVGQVLDIVMNPISENSPYQQLRTFSGVKPIPEGEDDFENWMDTDTQMVRDWLCSDGEKLKRITESMRAPALDAMRALRLPSSETTVINYLDVLESAYGTTESADDLYDTFRNSLHQDEGKFSEYVHRIEKLLCHVVLRGRIEAGQADKEKVEQVDRGALLDDLTVRRLQRDRKEDPPTFERLIWEVRAEEDKKETRAALRTTITQARPLNGRVVWGLSDASYPYLGYVVVKLEFPKEIARVAGPLEVVALICPEAREGGEDGAIIGTNAIFSRLAKWCQTVGGYDYDRTFTLCV